ncbi:MAG TPA: DNA polymerase III subunit delta [Cyclobacteriaceae bacterium]|nr:DNA polymerase III subunit delta [Cyclobacteriaceae bacterium]
MRFSDIPGSTQVKERLTQSVRNGKVAHAQLFMGREGALNLPLALASAQYLHCENKGETDACGVCPACSKSSKYVHPDTHFVFPLSNVKGDKDEERFKADIHKSWRSFLTEQPFGNLDDWTSSYGGEDKQVSISREESREIIKTLSLKAFESPFKVMIIWQPEYMHPSAANGILKILEEPAANTVFILVSNAAERLLPTILSRTQVVSVPLLSDEELEKVLIEKTKLDEARVRKIIQLAEGDINKALKLSLGEEDQNFELFFTWMLACLGRKYADLVTMADDFHAADKLSQQNLFYYSLGMLRETLLQLAGASTINRTKDSELERVQKFSKFMSAQKIDQFNQLINAASYHLERNGSAKMIFMDLSLNLSAIMNNTSLIEK